jgi:hypothetical protein
MFTVLSQGNLLRHLWPVALVRPKLLSQPSKLTRLLAVFSKAGLI